MTTPSSSDPQALAEKTFSGYRIERISIGDRQWEGPGIFVIPPYKGRSFWEVRIWDQEIIFASSSINVIIEASRLAIVEDDEELPEEE